MKILYGVCSDGLGHAMRARVVAAHLVAAGHDVRLAAFGRAAAVLRAHGLSVLDVRGLAGCYRHGSIAIGRTVLSAARGAPAQVRDHLRTALALAKTFAPDVALTDFSGFACMAARLCRCPVISLDHQHVIDRFRHPWSTIESFPMGFALARATVRAKTPGCQHYLVTSFFFPELGKSTDRATTLTGPVIRPEVQALSPTRGQHVLVYQTALGDTELVQALRSVRGVPFRVYGAGAAAKYDHVELRSFDEHRFLEDLASARAVVANGGFTTISEALYLGKAVLSIPLANQWEQVLNAAWLEKLGLGMRASRPSTELLRMFLSRIPDSRAAADQRLYTGTRDAMTHLDRVLAEVA